MSTKCVSYFRTSSSTNTGEEKDSLKRQKSVVHRYCDNNGFEIDSEFYETLRGDGEIIQTKVYGDDGGQLTAPEDDKIIKEINKIDYNDILFKSNPLKLTFIDSEIDNEYFKTVLSPTTSSGFSRKLNPVPLPHLNLG